MAAFLVQRPIIMLNKSNDGKYEEYEAYKHKGKEIWAYLWFLNIGDKPMLSNISKR